MTLRFYENRDDEDDEELLAIESESNPFIIGDTVWINIKNNLPNKWDVASERYYFTILKIDKQITKAYGDSVIEHLDILFYGKISKD